MSEGFEGAFPSDGWEVSGNPTWDDENCRASAGSWSGWCAGGGPNGQNCGTDYPNNANAWMIYGPFPLCDATSAVLTFKYWIDTETGYDKLWWGSSIDNTNYTWNSTSGSPGVWTPASFTLPYSYAGQPSVWIAFAFTSDGSVTHEGAYVDEIVLQKDQFPGLPDLQPYQPPGWSSPIVVSNVPGTHSSTSIGVNEPAYIDFAWQNIGPVFAPNHMARLLLDGVMIAYTNEVALCPGRWIHADDFSYTFQQEGLHLLTLITDAANSVAEGNESNNSFDQSIIVECRPAGPAVGSGCSVTGTTHYGLQTTCDPSVQGYILTDQTRIPSPHSIRTYQFVGSGLPGTQLADWDNDWNLPSQCPGVDAHHNTALAKDYMRYILGMTHGFDNADGDMRSTVEFTDHVVPLGPPCIDNAFYNGTQFVVCAASAGRRSCAGALDVVAHEWGHGVTSHSSQLEDKGIPGALGEAFSDMLGVAVGFWSGEDPDWFIGEATWQSPLGFMRDVSDPHDASLMQPGPLPDSFMGRYWFPTAGCSPDPDYNDNCCVHINCGVPDKMFYLLAHGGIHYGRSVSGIGIDNAMKLMYRANSRYWKSTTTLLEAAEGTSQAALDLNPSGAWAGQVRDAWVAVGVCDCPLQGDVTGDGLVDIYDVIQEVDIAFSGGADIHDPTCPATRGDVEYDTFVDVFDVVRLVNIANSGGTADNPCAP